MKFDLTITREEPHGPPDDLVYVDVEYTVEIEGNAHPAEPDVGLMSPYTEWWFMHVPKGWTDHELQTFLEKHYENEINDRILNEEEYDDDY